MFESNLLTPVLKNGIPGWGTADNTSYKVSALLGTGLIGLSIYFSIKRVQYTKLAVSAYNEELHLKSENSPR